MAFFIRCIAAIMCSFLSLFIPINSSEPYEAVQPEDCRMSFTVLSDTHIEGNNFKRCQIFGGILQDVKKNQSGNDALIFLGDDVMNGQHIESLLFYGFVDRYSPCKTVLNVQGNHDIGNGEGDFGKLFDRFCLYSNEFFGQNIEKPYYCKVINGCYFIVIGSEEQLVHEFYMSEEQLRWLETMVGAAKASDSPAFVLCHHTYMSVQDEAYDRLVDILSGYDKLLYIHGHSHVPIYSYDYYGINAINVSNCTAVDDNKEPEYNAGKGLVVEVYDDKVVVRARDFYTGEWLEKLEETYTFDNKEEEVVPIIPAWWDYLYIA